MTTFNSKDFRDIPMPTPKSILVALQVLHAACHPQTTPVDNSDTHQIKSAQEDNELEVPTEASEAKAPNDSSSSPSELNVVSHTHPFRSRCMAEEEKKTHEKP